MLKQQNVRDFAAFEFRISDLFRISGFGFRILFALILGAVLSSTASAQPRAYIGFVYPAGGEQGKTVQIRLGGQGLDDVCGVLVTGSGVTARLTENYRRLNNLEVEVMNEQLRVLRRETMSEPARAELMASENASMMSANATNRSSGVSLTNQTPGSSTEKPTSTPEDLALAAKKAEARKLMDRIERRTREWVPNPASAALASLAMVEVTIAPEAEPGEREIRLVTLRGISNPLPFYVGQVPEVSNVPMTSALQQVLGKESQALRKRTPSQDEQSISVPCTVNGQIASGEVNRYRFQARKGQRLVITTLGRQLVPFIADAVPGWLQPVLALYDAHGKEVAYDDDFRFKPDPTIFYEVPSDGEYVLAIRDSLYRGREDFVYRITIGELPFITSIFPLGGRANSSKTSEIRPAGTGSTAAIPLSPALFRGERENPRQSVGQSGAPETQNTRAASPPLPSGEGRGEGNLTSAHPSPETACTSPQMTGWNLEGAKLSSLPANTAAGVYSLSAVKKGLVSNRVPFALDTLPEVFEQEPNNTPAKAQKVTLPVIVNGRIGKPDDWDVFEFTAKSNDTIVAEVIARRLDSPLDSVIKLTDAAGNLLAFNDDHEDLGAGLNTHAADSYFTATLPADGNYYVHIGDTARQGGEEYGYRLRLSAPQPDFELRVVPSSISLRSKSSATVTVYAQRKDGFTNSIKLSLKEPPAGFTNSFTTISATQSIARFTVRSSLGKTEEPVALTIIGTAKVGDQELVHEAVPAEDRMQAFLWRHLVPANDFVASVFDPAYQPPPKRVAPVRAPVVAVTNAPVATNLVAKTNTVTGTNTLAGTNSPSGTNVVAKPKFTKQQVAYRLKMLKLLYEEDMFTDTFYEEKVAECEAAE